MKKMILIMMCCLLTLGCRNDPQKSGNETKEFSYVWLDMYKLEGNTITLPLGDHITLNVGGINAAPEMTIENEQVVSGKAEPKTAVSNIYTLTALEVGTTELTFREEEIKETWTINVVAMEISSPGISDGVIAQKYGMYGTQKKGGVPTLSIPIAIGNAPNYAVCYALVMIDPDAGNFVHWLATDFSLEDLIENASVQAADKMIQGKNDFGKKGYGGPTPPKTHKYKITVYALKEPLGLKPGYTYKQFKKALADKVLVSAEMSGKYKVK